MGQVYSAVFRTNNGAKSFEGEFLCQTGSRTDFLLNHVDPLSIHVPRFNMLKNDPCNAKKKWCEHNGDWSRFNKSVKAEGNNRTRRWQVLIPSYTGASWDKITGTGATAISLALSLCRHVDVFGYGLFHGEATDFRYIHWYDETPFWRNQGHAMID